MHYLYRYICILNIIYIYIYGQLSAKKNLLYAKNDSIHDHNTRYSNLLRVPFGSKSITSVSIQIWNVLSNIIDFS